MPGSFYVRAFIKQYAEAVGLDADEVLTEYRKDIPEMQKEEVAQSFTQSPSRRNMKATSSNKMMEAMPKLIVALFAIVIIIVITTLYFQKTGSLPDGGEEEIEPIEYEQNPNSTPTKPVEDNEEDAEEGTEENVEPEEPVTADEPEATQTISEGVVQGENSTFEVSGTDSLKVRVEVSGQTWVGIRNEQQQEQVNATVYNAGEIVENDSTADGYARIRLGNSKVAKVYVNDVELTYAQDRMTQNIILKLVNEGQGE